MATDFVAQRSLEDWQDVGASFVDTGDVSGDTLEDFALNDFSKLSLRSDHTKRPIWVTPSGRIFLETFSPFYAQAYDFLIAISEPITRPEFIHEYSINAFSLFAAASVGLDTLDILSGLDRFCKTNLHRSLVDFIINKTHRCGKVKILLDQGRFFVESRDPLILQTLLQNDQINASRIDTISSKKHELWDYKTGFIKTVLSGQQAAIRLGGESGKEVDQDAAMGIERVIKNVSGEAVYSFEIDPLNVEIVRRNCQTEGYPTLEEYDFRRDSKSANLTISLRPIAHIRDYQEKSLSKMFGNGRARSGLIVLPCGAGKTLVGITATCTIRKNTIVFCNTGVSVNQWKEQFQRWANIPDSEICLFTSNLKQELNSDAVLLITTYNMIAYSGSRGTRARKIMDQIEQREWGLVILDEVHVAPARTFRKCVSVTKSRCKLGLTATLLREDDLIDDLFFLIGPKLYEANWLSLQKEGYLATVQCVEVRCPMTAEFYSEYLKEESRRKQLLYVMNPNKFRACEYLIKWHESRGDKVLVFSDIIYSLEKYARDLKKPYLHGSTSDKERMEFLSHLQFDDNVNTLFISKIGDTSIDLPDVNVIIQISSHYASRRQEAQRLGRILRPKSTSSSRFNAFFYTLISEDTKEVKYATKRQRFLVDQGYSYQTVTYDNLVDNDADLHYSSKRDQIELLTQIKSLGEESGQIEDLKDEDEMENNLQRRRENKSLRKQGHMSLLSGGMGRLYHETSNSEKKGVGSIFKQKLQQRKRKMEYLKNAQSADMEVDDA